MIFLSLFYIDFLTEISTRWMALEAGSHIKNRLSIHLSHRGLVKGGLRRRANTFRAHYKNKIKIKKG